MKTLLLTLYILVLGFTAAFAQASESISETLTLPANSNQYTLKIMNIHGKVEVQGYNGNAVELQAKKTVEARRDTDAAHLKAAWTLRFKQEGNTILLYADGPGVEVKQNSKGEWSHNVKNGDDKQGRVIFDMVLRVPDQVVVRASTIDGGHVNLQDLKSDAEAVNVNGPVSLTNMSGNVSATTVNGDVEVQSKSAPSTDTNFTTVNGNIRLTYPSQLAANIQYTSISGDFYTDFDVTTAALKEEKKQNGGTYFKIGGKNSLQVGQGGPKIKMTTINGDMFLKKGSN